jgi:hypothetical protein
MCLNVCVFFIHISSHITVNVHCCKHKQVNMVSNAFLSILKQFLQQKKKNGKMYAVLVISSVTLIIVKIRTNCSCLDRDAQTVNMVSNAFLSILKQFLQLLLIIMSNVNEMLQILGVLSKTDPTRYACRITVVVGIV